MHRAVSEKLKKEPSIFMVSEIKKKKKEQGLDFYGVRN